MERSVVVFFELDVEIGNLLAQRVAVDAEDLRGANLVAAGFFERQFDQRALDSFDDQLIEIVHVYAFGAAEVVF